MEHYIDTRKMLGSDIVFSLSYILFLLQDALSGYFGIHFFAYNDELNAATCFALVFLYVVSNIKQIRLTKVWAGVCVSWVAMIIIGTLSSMISEYQTLPYTLLDIITCSKFYVAFLFPIITQKNISKYGMRYIAVITKIFICILFFLVLHEILFTPMFPYFEEKNIRGLQLFYSNPTYLAAYGIMLLVVLFLTREYQKHFMVLAIMGAAVVASTTRSKAIGAICVMALLYIAQYSGNAKWAKKKLFISIPIALISIIVVAYDKIALYFFTPEHYSPRRILLVAGVGLAKKWFPLGAGYGSFCSVASMLNRSPVYEQIGYEYFSAVYDNFYACLVGQFGLIGLLLFVYGIISIFFTILKLLKYKRNYYFSAMFALIYLLIASLGECSFFSPYSVGYGFVIGIAISKGMSLREGRKDGFHEKNFTDKQYVSIQ